MNTFDDSDMKIFGVKEEPDSTDGAEVQALAEEMKRQRLNGNSERAKQLGIRMAALAPDSAWLLLPRIPQMRIASTFPACWAIPSLPPILCAKSAFF